MIENWKLGSDPEFLLMNHQSKPVSVEGMLGCSKENPLDIGNGCAIQEDCVAVEFNIPPVNNADDFVEYIRYSIATLRGMIRRDLHFSFLPSAEFDEIQLSTEQSREGGCDPDKNVWDEDAECKPNLSATSRRAAGSHLHLSYLNPNEETSLNFIKIFEVYGTIPTLKYEEKLSAIFRRELYGAAGSYRIKPYGVEYRSLSSFWLQYEEWQRLIYDKVAESVDRLNADDGSLIESINADHKAIVRAINFHDKVSVDYMQDKYKLAI
jgi:hypothetical protein